MKITVLPIGRSSSSRARPRGRKRRQNRIGLDVEREDHAAAAECAPAGGRRGPQQAFISQSARVLVCVQHVVLGEDVQRRQRGAAGQRVAGVGMRVQEAARTSHRRRRRINLVRRHDRQRQIAAADAFDRQGSRARCPPARRRRRCRCGPQPTAIRRQIRCTRSRSHWRAPGAGIRGRAWPCRRRIAPAVRRSARRGVRGCAARWIRAPRRRNGDIGGALAARPRLASGVGHDTAAPRSKAARRRRGNRDVGDRQRADGLAVVAAGQMEELASSAAGRCSASNGGDIFSAISTAEAPSEA